MMVKALVQSFAGVVRYDLRRWTRVVYERECTRLLQDIKIDTLDVAGDIGRRTSAKRCVSLLPAANYPEFDLHRHA